MPSKITEIRCPIYGFVTLDEWEREIISQPAFQRLRRIRQLGWTDAVYPGAMHTRFEHSLGVMHMATQLYDGIVQRSGSLLQDEHGYDEAGRNRYRKLVRLAALLHDVGHGPFSHAVEELAPIKHGEIKVRRWRHEEYSTAIVREFFRDIIENHKANNNYGFKVEDVAGLIEGKASAGRAALWQELISGQLDADRMDYLLRDSFHAGVEYGRYDWRRVVASVELVRDVESEELRFGISDGGRHVAEALIIARYMMFSQIYFHKVRVILDYHLHHAVEDLLQNGHFPAPIGDGVKEYLAWDDWRVLGAFSEGRGGDHAKRLRERRFYRLVWETPEFPSEEDIKRLEDAETVLSGLSPVKHEAGKSWYKVGVEDLPISASHAGEMTKPLSLCSAVVKDMKPSRCVRLYVCEESRQEAQRRLKEIRF